MSTRVVVVFGATGNQGSAVVEALLADGTFVPRAVTRDPNSEKALKLKQRGAEIVQADYLNVESLTNAMSGAEGVFGVTNYFDPKLLALGHDAETRAGKNLVDAAVASKVKLFIWSSLLSPTKATNGKYTEVHHFETKAKVDDYLRSTQLPYSILYPGWFIENTRSALSPSPDSSSYKLTVPKYDPISPQYFTWVQRDLGQCALALLKHYKDEHAHILGEGFYAVSDKRTYAEYAAAIQKALGKPVHFVNEGSMGTEEFDQMLQYQSEFGFYPNATIPDSRLVHLGVKFNTLETYVQEVVKKQYA